MNGLFSSSSFFSISHQYQFDWGKKINEIILNSEINTIMSIWNLKFDMHKMTECYLIVCYFLYVTNILISKFHGPMNSETIEARTKRNQSIDSRKRNIYIKSQDKHIEIRFYVFDTLMSTHSWCSTSVQTLCYSHHSIQY